VTEAIHQAVAAVARSAQDEGWMVATAESLTCGRIVHELGAGEKASQWLAGGVVAYSSEVKFEVLGVERGPVISASCAREMVRGVTDLLKVDAAVAITGCGGPGPEEDSAPGTVFIAVAVRGRLEETHDVLEGPPEKVLEQATEQALDLLATTMRAVRQTAPVNAG
jgi:nicotinamide-nucleotide amidase